MMNNIKILYEEYCKKIDEQPVSSINQDQKELIKHILKNAKEDEIDSWYRFLIKNIKLGFVFDEAPETIHDQVALVKKDEIRSFENHGGVKHKLIIGENYDALKNLLITHKNKVDVIYIDPPYNTEASSSDGNDYKEDVKSSKFIYRDKFSREGWLNMINERLKLAKELLADDGVIFVSIDDSEQAYLKVLMDDIFGEENFVGNFIWQKKNEGSAEDSKYIKILNEYVLFYSKNLNLTKINYYFKDLDDGSYKLSDKWLEVRGKYKLKQLDFSSLTWSQNLDYIIEYNDKQYYAGGSQQKWEDRKNGMRTVKDWQWRWSKEKFEWGLKNDFIVFKNDKIYTKQYQFVNNNNELIERTSKYSNLILDMHNTVATSEQKSIFDKKVFDHPKPTKLIKFLLNLSINKQATTLDFFGGSGTTGHAVMELNQEDGGNRQFILCTNNENQIADKVTYERLYRVINGIGTNKEEFEWKYSKDLKSLKNNNLDVFEIKYHDTKISKNIDKLKEEIKTQISLLSDNQINLSDEKDILRKLLSLRPQNIKKE